jgi:hypothetical protein
VYITLHYNLIHSHYHIVKSGHATILTQAPTRAMPVDRSGGLRLRTISFKSLAHSSRIMISPA